MVVEGGGHKSIFLFLSILSRIEGLLKPDFVSQFCCLFTKGAVITRSSFLSAEASHSQAPLKGSKASLWMYHSSNPQIKSSWSSQFFCFKLKNVLYKRLKVEDWGQTFIRFFVDRYVHFNAVKCLSHTKFLWKSVKITWLCFRSGQKVGTCSGNKLLLLQTALLTWDNYRSVTLYWIHNTNTEMKMKEQKEYWTTMVSLMVSRVLFILLIKEWLVLYCHSIKQCH